MTSYLYTTYEVNGKFNLGRASNIQQGSKNWDTKEKKSFT
jgi:hypothetical protein